MTSGLVNAVKTILFAPCHYGARNFVAYDAACTEF